LEKTWKHYPNSIPFSTHFESLCSLHPDGPSEVVAKEAIITLLAGISLSLSCAAADSNPEAVVSYELDGKKMVSSHGVGREGEWG
jgi:hypothetical protein